MSGQESGRRLDHASHPLALLKGQVSKYFVPLRRPPSSDVPASVHHLSNGLFKLLDVVFMS